MEKFLGKRWSVEKMGSLPKIIHYIWIGNNPKPEIVLKCIESWRRYLPDYEIREWNENNYNVNKNEYISNAYENKMWAFVSDFMRFDILYRYGGIYLDTDVEFLHPLPLNMMESEAFSGSESNGKISPGLIFACNPGNEIVAQMIASYENSAFNVKKLITVNERITDIMKVYGYVPNNQLQTVAGLTVYPDVYFCGFDKDVGEVKTTVNTLAIHHYAGTWRKNKISKMIRKSIKKLIGIEGYRNLLKLRRTLFK